MNYQQVSMSQQPSVRCQPPSMSREVSQWPAGVRVSMHPYQWSREVCVIANYITFGMVSRPCELSAIMYEPAGVFLVLMEL